MKKALITGVTGFVGKYLASHLIQQGIEVWGTSRKDSPYLFLDSNKKVNLFHTNLNSMGDIYNVLAKVKPDYVFHLAAQSNVKYSWDHKEETFYTNVNKTIFLLDACVKFQNKNPEMRIMTVGSSEEYGKVEPHELPIKESTPLRPMSPYGASKAVISMLIQQYHKAYGLNIIHVRPFNHIGPGQSEGFVTTDFAKRIVEIEKGFVEPILHVGDLSSSRDFTDVLDIVKAYYLLSEKGMPGNIYNICSGLSVSIQKILDELVSFSKEEITILVDENKLRPISIKDYYGSNQKIRCISQWEPSFSIKESLKHIYLYWKEKNDLNNDRMEN